MVPSSLPVASHLPSQWKATAVTFAVWFSNVAICHLSRVSHKCNMSVSRTNAHGVIAVAILNVIQPGTSQRGFAHESSHQTGSLNHRCTHRTAPCPAAANIRLSGEMASRFTCRCQMITHVSPLMSTNNLSTLDARSSSPLSPNEPAD